MGLSTELSIGPATRPTDSHWGELIRRRSLISKTLTAQIAELIGQQIHLVLAPSD